MTHPAIYQLAPKIVLLRWSEDLGLETSEMVWQWDAYLNEHYRDQLVETVIAYREIALYVSREEAVKPLIDRLERVRLDEAFKPWGTPKIVSLPVCYGDEFGPDLEQLALGLELSTKQVVELHCATTYQVAFLGFLPGFAYLNGLDPKLHFPRKSMPRPQVPAGAVGIGGMQTGVYPMDSPGGWNIIGRSPIPLFSTKRKTPTLLAAGNQLRFRPITKAEYELMTIEVQTQTFQYEKLQHD